MWADTGEALTGADTGDVNVVVGVMRREGLVDAAGVRQLRQQLRTHLRAAKGEAAASVCGSAEDREEAAACRAQLQTQVQVLVVNWLPVQLCSRIFAISQTSLSKCPPRILSI